MLAFVLIACAAIGSVETVYNAIAQVTQSPPVDMSNLTIGQIAAANPNFSTLVNLTRIANLTDVLNGPLPLTVFAPTNDAFAKLPPALVQSLLNNTLLLRSTLAYHVVPNVALAPSDLQNLRILPTGNGLVIDLSTTANGTIRVNNASLVMSSIRARNGIINVVDTVLTSPPNATAVPLTVPANQTAVTAPFDLTNQRSPYASALISNFSFTRLVNTSLPQVNVELTAANFTAPMMIVSANDQTGRLFVVDQIGLVWIIAANGTRMQQPFLDLRNSIVPLNPVYDERGLLSLAVHPNFTRNGKLYVHYDAPLRTGGPANWSHTVHIAEFTVDSTNPNRVNASSERTLLLVDKPQSNHNGGPVLFGADGYFYITLGDGGGANDVGLGHTNQTGNAQDLTKVLGKTLRINVDQTGTTIRSTNQTQQNLTYVIFSGSDVIGNRPYGIPADNPFVGVSPLPVGAYGANIPINGTIPPEIYSYGHRNPAFATFYSNNSNLLFIAEAGQQLFEEVNIVRKGGNYGWHIFEGTHPFNATFARNVPANASTTGYLGEPLIGPIFEGGHDLGVVVVGGQVYWGNAIPEMRGKYVFGYFANAPAVLGNGTLLAASPPFGWNASANIPMANGMMAKDNAMWETQRITIANAQATNATDFMRGVFADQNGELYVMMSSVLGPDVNTTTGRIYKIVSAANVSQQTSFSANLTGAPWTSRVNSSVTYATNTSAQGMATFEVINNTAIRYTLTVSNIENLTMSHIHLDNGSVVGPIMDWLYPQNRTPQLISGRFSGVLAQGNITAADFVGPLAGQSMGDLIAMIRAGRTYVEVHSVQNPQGEIRGYIQ